MTGILLFAAMGAWLYVVLWFGRSFAAKLQAARWRGAVRALTVLLLLPLPLIDEIVGGRQFAALCKEHSAIHVDREKAVGRTVFLAKTLDVEIKGTWVRVVLKPWRFVDAATGETVVSYSDLVAGSGRLMQLLGIFEGGRPLTFKGTCVPANRPGSVETFKPFGITYIEPPSNR